MFDKTWKEVVPTELHEMAFSYLKDILYPVCLSITKDKDYVFNMRVSLATNLSRRINQPLLLFNLDVVYNSKEIVIILSLLQTEEDVDMCVVRNYLYFYGENIRFH